MSKRKAETGTEISMQEIVEFGDCDWCGEFGELVYSVDGTVACSYQCAILLKKHRDE